MPTATSATAIETRAPTMIIDEHVAAEVVGAEPVRGRGRLQLARRCRARRRRRASRRRRRAPRARRPRRCAPPSDERAHQRAPQPRVDRGIGEVDEEGDEDHREDQQHHHALDHDQVALADRLEHQPAEAGQEEDVLDDDRAGEQEGELQPDDGQHRDQRVAERVPAQRLAAGQPLGAGGADEVLAERVDQRRAHHPRQDRGLRQRQRDRRQGQRLQARRGARRPSRESRRRRTSAASPRRRARAAWRTRSSAPRRRAGSRP